MHPWGRYAFPKPTDLPLSDSVLDVVKVPMVKPGKYVILGTILRLFWGDCLSPGRGLCIILDRATVLQYSPSALTGTHCGAE